MRAVLILSTALCLIGFAARTPQGEAALAPVMDRFDQRPARKILIIGNSRTYWHQMPTMVRRIGDSAKLPVRLDITTLAWGGASFETNWNNAEVQRALGQRWDQIILQPESRVETDIHTHESFAAYGAKLIQAGRSTNSPVALVINWGYGEVLYGGYPPETRQLYIQRIEDAERTLASDDGAQVIDTSAVWEKVHAAAPDLQLYEDGNHPTVYGSYLSALMLEGFLAGGEATKTSYDPPDANKDSTAIIKNAVFDYYRG